MKIIGSIRRKKSSTGFTITEVIVAAVIFTIAMAGIFTSISNLRQPAAESSQEVTAAFIGKKILDNLRTQVSAQTWNGVDGLLSLGTHSNSVTVGNMIYDVMYNVENDPAGTGARRVTLNVTW